MKVLRKAVRGLVRKPSDATRLTEGSGSATSESKRQVYCSW